MPNTKQEIRRAVATLKDRPCEDCRQTFDPVCMDFDHRPGEIKAKGIARMIGDGATLEQVLAEVAKCDLVCANCHRIRTHERR